MKYIIFMLLASMAFIASSCMRDDLHGLSDDNLVSVRFRIETPSAGRVGTYALNVADEWFMGAVDVMAFRFNEDDGLEYFAYRVSANDISGDGATKEFTVTLQRSDESYRFVVLVNARQQIDALGEIASSGIKENVLDRLIVENPGMWNVTASNDFTPFPMWGESELTTISENTDIGAIMVVRAVVRIDVNVDAAVDNFMLASVHLYNRNTAGTIVPSPPHWDASDHRVIEPTLPQAPGKVLSPLHYTEVPFVRQIYTLEAVAVPDNLLQATCIVVGGFFGTSTDTTYYRIDFKDDSENYMALLRNHLYSVIITEAGGPGFPTPDEAFANRQVNITAGITAWNETETPVEFGFYLLRVDRDEFNTGSGEYTSSISVLTNYPDGWTGTVSGDAADWLSITGSASGPANIEADLSFTAAPFDGATPSRTGIIMITAGNLTKNIYVTQTFVPGTISDFANSYIVPPGSFVDIPVQRIYDIWQEEGLGALAGPITVSLVWKDTPGALSATTSIQEISLLGGDQGASSTIRVTTGSSTGNAVIAMQVNSAIRWSWHIWVTTYNPNSAEAEAANGAYPVQDGNIHRFQTANGRNNNVFMDRNLGALSANTADVNARGLLYQWGRLSPLPGSRSATLNDSQEPQVYNAAGEIVTMDYQLGTAGGNLATALANPFLFYGNAGASDWFTPSLPKRTNWWCNANGTKGTFDPCPAGWRVPTYTGGNTNTFSWTDSPWYIGSITYTPSNYGVSTWLPGWNFQAGVFPLGYFPATGHRNEVNGNLTSVLYNGSYWTATAYSGTLYRFYFHINSTHVGPVDYGDSNWGNNVRCVRDN